MSDDTLRKVIQQDQTDLQRSLNNVNNLFQGLNQGQQQNTSNTSTGTTEGGTGNQSDSQ